MDFILRKEGLLGWCTLEQESGHQAGRRLLAALWQRCSREPMPELAVSPRGKPYFPNSHWHFSISHTHRHAFCILSTQPVGLDAEEKTRVVSPRLASKLLSPREQEGYLLSGDKEAYLLKLWVLKEASVKLTGEGLRGYPNHTDFADKTRTVTEIDGCYVAVLTKEEPPNAI